MRGGVIGHAEAAGAERGESSEEEGQIIEDEEEEQEGDEM